VSEERDRRELSNAHKQKILWNDKTNVEIAPKGFLKPDKNREE
jgi:hypothetical protein